MTSYLTKQRTDRKARIDRAKEAAAKGETLVAFAVSEGVTVSTLRNFMRKHKPEIYEKLMANSRGAGEPTQLIEQDRIERLSRDAQVSPDRAAWLLSAFAVPVPDSRMERGG